MQTMRKLSIVLIVTLFALLPLSAQISVIYPTVKDLGVRPGWDESSADALNWISQVTGTLRSPVGGGPDACHAFLWNALTGMKDIGTVDDFCASGRKIDFFGRVAGVLNKTGVQGTFFYGPGSPIASIGSLPGFPNSTVLQDLNNLAEIVGFGGASGSGHAFYWSRATGIVDIHPSGADHSAATSINDQGKIVGQSKASGVAQHAMYMASHGSPMVDLALDFPDIPANSTSFAFRINSRNQISGEYKVGTFGATTNIVFFIPDPNGSAIYFTDDLGPYGTTVWRGMNDAGQVIGIYNPAHLQHPPAAGDPPVAFQSFRWTPGPGAPVQVLLPLAGDDASQPIAINSSGQVVGESHVLSGTQKAVLWKAGSTVATALPPLVAGQTCIATDINDFGVIAGLCHTATGTRAVLWQPKLHLGF
jgi:uncharacterized membrane protein